MTSHDYSSGKQTGLLTRRCALKGGLTLAGLGITLSLGACKDLLKAARGKAQFFSPDQLSVLEHVAETILPATDTPGARAANVHGFIDALMMEWARQETRDFVIAALTYIDARAQQQFSQSFPSLSAERQHSIVSAIDKAAFAPGAGSRSAAPFRKLKALVYDGYYLSKIGATVELQYELVPGAFRGCVPLSEAGRTWAE